MAVQGDGVPEPVAETAVAEAVARAVREGGRQLSAEPRRVQGMVNDVLGAESRTRRAEVDAVVVAAEESVPEDLIAGRIDVDEAIGRLRARGLDAGVALFAVDVWRYALGMLGDTSEPPSLRNSLQATSETTITDPMPQDTVLPPNLRRELADGQGHDAAPPAAVTGTDGEATRLRVPVLIGVAAAVLGLLVAGLVVLATSRDDDNETIAADSIVESTAATTSTSPSTTSTTVPEPAPVVEFDPESSAIGEVTRTWELDDDALAGTVTIVNTSETAATGTHYEVLPASMIPNAAAVTAASDFTVIKDTPAQGLLRVVDDDAYVVVAWDIDVAARSDHEITYNVAIPEQLDVTDEMLETWRNEQLAAAEHFAAVRDTPPTLAITTAQDQEFAALPVTITGTVEPGSTLTANGIPVTVAADGTWTFPWPEPAPVELTATNPYGVTSTATFTFTIAAPTTTTAPPRTPSNPTPTNRTPNTPATTTKTTTKPAPAPLSVSITGPSLVTVGCDYTYSASANESASYAWSGFFSLSGSPVLVNVFRAGSFTLTVTATTGDGRTAKKSMTVNAQSPEQDPTQGPSASC